MSSYPGRTVLSCVLFENRGEILHGDKEFLRIERRRVFPLSVCMQQANELAYNLLASWDIAGIYRNIHLLCECVKYLKQKEVKAVL